MPKREAKRQRKCSVCRQPGHTKRSCPDLQIEPIKKAPKKNPWVFVKVAEKAPQSPHVVDLKKNKKKNVVWKNVEIFGGKEKLRQERVEVNLADMVRLANQKSKIKNQTTINKKSKKVVVKKKVVKKKEFKLPKLTLPKVSFNFPEFNFKKLAHASVALFVLTILPFPAMSYYNDLKDTSSKVVQESTNAFLSLQSSTVAALQANVDQAQYDLNSALESFGNANSILEKEHKALQYVAGLLPVIGKQINSRQSLLVAGHHLALGNTYLVKGMNEVNKDSEMPLTERFDILSSHLRSAVPQYKEALEKLSFVDAKTIPVEYQSSFSEFKLLFASFIDDMQDIVKLSKSIKLVFGDEQFKRYLLVFQNNHELRATGGFIGSFAVMDVQKGKIVNLDIPSGGSYDLQGQLSEYVKPPLPLQLVNDRWEFQDSNWFPDFPASAEKMEWFFENSRNMTVDGVIAINASVLERLLGVVGPVLSIEHGLEIDEENALEKIQYEVEVNYDREENKPKEVLSSLAGEFLTVFENVSLVNAVQLLANLNESLEQKEIQVYFNDKAIQSEFGNFGWTGELTKVNSEQDYLSVVNTNIQGQKSDAKIKQRIEHQAVVQEDGSIIDTVIIHREHEGVSGEIFYGANNVDYVRVYVPQGSELLEAGGFVYPPEEAFKVPESWYDEDLDLKNNEKEISIDAKTGTRITEEFSKTAFGNWSMVEPGSLNSIYFVYKLPFKINLEKVSQTSVAKWRQVLLSNEKDVSKYSLLVQKQSGIESELNHQVIYPKDWLSVWKIGDDVNLALNGASLDSILNTDKVFGVVMEKNNF